MRTEQPTTDSITDGHHLAQLRQNITSFLSTCYSKYLNTDKLVLNAGCGGAALPQEYFNLKLQSLDISPHTGATYIADLCENNKENIPNCSFDAVLCMEVLEHVKNPFKVAKELYRMLKVGGYLFLSVPLNFRIHEPIQEYWRFTENGLKLLFKSFEIISLEGLSTKDRPAFPIQYTMAAKKR